MNKKKVNIIILNYNGKALLEKYLESVVNAASLSQHDCTVSVVDNLSSDASVSYIRSNFPHVAVYIAKENRIMCSLNEYLDLIKDEIVVFLNNDVRVDKNFIDPLVSHFKEKDILFVAPKELDMEGKYRGNLNKISFRWGLLFPQPYLEKKEEARYNLCVGGGAFDREKLLYLGGFDEIFLPGTFEDFDVCYRGWKHGWKGIYEPKSFYYHEGSATFDSEFGVKGRMQLVRRNAYLFFWKNVTSKRMIFVHIILIPPVLLSAFVRCKWFLIKAFFRALVRLDEALDKRKGACSQFILRDDEIGGLVE